MHPRVQAVSIRLLATLDTLVRQALFVALLVGTSLAFLATTASAVLALTPTSPEVKQAVDRGVQYLLTNQDPRLGAKALVGRVMIAQRRRDDERVRAAVLAIQDQVRSGAAPDIYSLGLSILFLIELDSDKYQPELEQLLAMLQKAQKHNGGWGYPERETGDTSMTQYAVLSAWAASEIGQSTPRGFWLSAMNWLLRTQDPSGGFGYQGVVSPDDKLIAQPEVSVTLTYAGLGSLYLCADRLGMVRLASDPAAKVPDVFRRVERSNDAGDTADQLEARRRLDEKFRAATDRALAWYRQHEKQLAVNYVSYFFYTLERLETIREAVSGKIEPQPVWYHDAATYLLKHQLRDGSWNSQEGSVPATAFAILTLIRSTREVIEKTRGYGAGTLISGRGLPSGKDGVELRLGQLVAKPLSGPAESLLSKLENAEAPDYNRAVEALDDLAREASEARLTLLAARLRSLAQGAPPEAKAAALRALSRARNFEDAPLMIAALSDPEPVVFRAAHESLLWLTRRTGIAPVAQNPTADDRAVVIKRWRDWLKTIQPEAIVE